jgi:hypothetical protein
MVLSINLRKSIMFSGIVIIFDFWEQIVSCIFAKNLKIRLNMRENDKDMILSYLFDIINRLC